MTGSNFMQGWLTLTGSLAMIALILTAFGIMLGIVKPADALKRIGAILGIVILLLLIPDILVGVWAAIPLWQRLVLAAIVLGVFLLKRPRRGSRNK